MKIIFIILMLVMILFMGVQFNDPDGLLWMGIYLVPAIWCAAAVFRKTAFAIIAVKVLLIICIMAGLIGVFWFWPLTPRFWTQEIWYSVETAREGMGMMIVVGVLLLVYFTYARCVSEMGK